MSIFDELRQKIDEIKKQGGDAVTIKLDTPKLIEQIKLMGDAMAENNQKNYDSIKQTISKILDQAGDADRREIQEVKAQVSNALKLIKEQAAKKIEFPPFPKSMKIDKPEWYEPFDQKSFVELGVSIVKGAAKDINDFLKQILFKIDLSLHQDKRRALAVRLVTADGRQFYTAEGGGQGGGGVGGVVSLDGNPSLGQGNGTVASGGTPVQLSDSSIPCKFVTITAHEDNSGLILIGDENVKADSSDRKGVSLFSTQSYKFTVSDLNKLWIDSVEDGDKFHFYYEN